jgi:hypothetical protein
MNRTNFRFALAAVLATLSAPALAFDSSDGTQPAIENSAPAIVLHAQGGAAQAFRGELYPATDNAAPAIALVAIPDDGGPQAEPAEAWETPSVGIALSAPKATEQVAAVR